jgi:hypothetical protein
MSNLNDVTPSEWDRVARASSNQEEVNGLATGSQVGGGHYKHLGIQPLELTYQNFGYYGVRSAVYTKVNKYLTRDKASHVEDLEKAKHCIEMQIEFAKRGSSEKL